MTVTSSDRPQINRRTSPRYANIDAMLADIAQLRRGYTMGGRWSLPQICWHINLAYPLPLEGFDHQEELTDAQKARQQRWDYYIRNGKPPTGFESPAEMVPPAEVPESEIDAMVERLKTLRDLPTKFVRVAAGVMPIERARGFMLAHGWWHLSCLHAGK